MPMTREQHQEWLGTARNASSSWKYVHLLTEQQESILLQTKPSSLPKLQKALDQGMIVAPRRLQTSTATRVRRLGWNEQESKQNGASCYCWKLFHNITTLHPWDEGAVCCDEYSQDYFKPWDEQYPKCNSHWWQCGFKNDQQDHSRLEHLWFDSADVESWNEPRAWLSLAARQSQWTTSMQT